MKIQKPILIAGGIALALGAIWYIKKSEKPAEEFIPTAAPATYYGSQEAAGNFGNFGGGGAPSSPAPGVTTAPEPEHNFVCKPGEQAVGISAIGGQTGGIKCIPRNGPQGTGNEGWRMQPELPLWKSPKAIGEPGLKPA